MLFFKFDIHVLNHHHVWCECVQCTIVRSQMKYDTVEYILFCFAFTNVVIWFISYFLLSLVHMRAAAVLFFCFVCVVSRSFAALFFSASFGNRTNTYTHISCDASRIKINKYLTKYYYFNFCSVPIMRDKFEFKNFQVFPHPYGLDLTNALRESDIVVTCVTHLYVTISLNVTKNIQTNKQIILERCQKSAAHNLIRTLMCLFFWSFPSTSYNSTKWRKKQKSFADSLFPFTSLFLLMWKFSDNSQKKRNMENCSENNVLDIMKILSIAVEAINNAWVSIYTISLCNQRKIRPVFDFMRWNHWQMKQNEIF